MSAIEALSTVLPLLAFALLTAVNAFFVAAEFSLVTVDRAAVDQQIAEGDRTALGVRKALRELSFQLSGAQVGITIAALLTGYLAKPALAPLLGFTGPAAPIVALLLATLISMLFGELVPKNAAIARPMRLARLTAGPQRLFSRTLSWLIRALNASANWVVRRLGVEPQEELASARSPEELCLLAAYSAEAGALPEETAVLLRRTIRFGEKRAAEAMTPRVDVMALPAHETVETLLDLARTSGFSRFPVYEGTLDQVVGVAGVTDALGIPPGRRGTTAVRTVAREPVLVPGSLDLDGVLATLQRAGADIAIVVDEYGGTDGVVTLEDLVEELVGAIVDEHDLAEPVLADVVGTAEVTAPGGERSWLLDGGLREDEVVELTGFRLPEGPYETLAGFILARLGHIPVAGETVVYAKAGSAASHAGRPSHGEGAWEFTVIEVEKRRIEQVRLVAPELPHD